VNNNTIGGNMLQRLRSFIADADVIGSLKEVEYDHKSCMLIIRNVNSSDEAATILDSLSNGELKGVRVSSLTSSPGKPTPAQAEKEVSVPVNVNAEELYETVAKETKALIETAEELHEAAEELKEPVAEIEEKAETTDGRTTQPETPSKTKKRTPAKKRAGKQQKSTVQQDILEPKESLDTSAKEPFPQKVLGSGMPDAIKNAQSMREVLNYIYKTETEDIGEITNRCHELRSLGHTVFMRCPENKLPDRIVRCLTTMELISDED
jgi:hypothetical protein